MWATFRSRNWLIIEPIVLLIALGLLAKFIAVSLGIDADLATIALQNTPPSWNILTSIEAQSMAVKWGLLLAAAFVLSRYRGYKISRPTSTHAPILSFPQLIVLGLSFAIPLKFISILPRWYHYSIEPIGKAPPIWDIIYGSQWTFEFWIFMAVGSFALVPIVEELFFRGYLLGSLHKKFSRLASILISAGIFALVHLQYVGADLFSLYNLSAVFMVGAAYAWLVFKTHSLIPAIAGHAYGNTPMPLEWFPYEGFFVVPAIIVSAIILFGPNRAEGRASPEGLRQT